MIPALGLLLLALVVLVLAYRRLSERLDDAEENLAIERSSSRSATREVSEPGTFRLVMESLGQPVILVDPDFKVLFLNQEFRRFWGEEGATLSAFIRNPAVVELFQAVSADPVQRGLEVTLETREGNRTFVITASSLGSSQGEVVAVFHDVSDLKQSERVRIDFVANVSHELRTPLTAISGYSETILMDLRANRLDSIEKFTEVIARNAKRLQDLVEDLLDLSALESGVGLNREWLSTQALTHKVTDSLEGKRQAKSVKWKTECQSSRVFADPKRIEQVLVNLLDNAIKYGPESGEVSVLWYPELRHDASGVVLEVRDQGPGIAAESQARLFERFYRVDQSRTRAEGGTGLGLSIVKHILSRHQGLAWVESVHGEGARFKCWFPSE